MRTPVIVLVLAATAIPIEFRSPSHATFAFGIDPPLHFLANVAGYVPVGIVLGELGLLRAVATAAAISVFAETSQLAMLYRDPSSSDVLANILGAMLGVAITKRWRIAALDFQVERRVGFAAAAVACGIVFWMWQRSGGPVNPRGWASPGTLEAHWTFDEDRGRVARDSSGRNLPAIFNHEPVYGSGPLNRAAVFDGHGAYLKTGRATAIRLLSSMTIAAWINSASFPGDDAAIVSQLDHHLGYQLDTTVDRGPRTIGFKLTSACGQLMIRYGRTPLAPNTWYHVAGVYDAAARSLDVFLNGEPDNGFLDGLVTGTQHPSRAAVYVGRRADLEGFGFTGQIDDVRIYSLALTKAQIAEVMHDSAMNRGPGRVVMDDRGTKRPKDTANTCAVFAEPDDIELPLAAATVGALAAMACIGLWSTTPSLLPLAAGMMAGSLLLLGTSADLPSFDYISIPLTALAGGASIVSGLRLSKRF